MGTSGFEESKAKLEIKDRSTENASTGFPRFKAKLEIDDGSVENALTGREHSIGILMDVVQLVMCRKIKLGTAALEH